MALEQAPAFLGHDHCVLAVTGHTRCLDQSLFAQMPEVARAWVGRSVVVILEIATWTLLERAVGSDLAGWTKPRTRQDSLVLVARATSFPLESADFHAMH